MIHELLAFFMLLFGFVCTLFAGYAIGVIHVIWNVENYETEKHKEQIKKLEDGWKMRDMELKIKAEILKELKQEQKP